MEDSTENSYMLGDETDVSSHSTLCDSILQPLASILRYFGFNHHGPYRPTPDDCYADASLPPDRSEVVSGRVPRPTPDDCYADASLPPDRSEVVSGRVPRPTPDDCYADASLPPDRSEVVSGRVPRPPPSKGGGGQTN